MGISKRIQERAAVAHELMNRKRNPLSVRAACDKAEVSPASYYKVFPVGSSAAPAQTEGTQVEATVKKHQRKPRVTSGSTVRRNPSISRATPEIKKELKNYISKMNKNLLHTMIDEMFDEE